VFGMGVVNDSWSRLRGADPDLFSVSTTLYASLYASGYKTGQSGEMK
jgi:hypothetical protein